MFAIPEKGNEARRIIVTENESGGLSDEYGIIYTGSFNGKDVILSSTNNNQFIASWVLGNSRVSNVPGSGALRNFSFTFFDYGHGNQRLHALWTFPGNQDQAIRAFHDAGYFASFLDNHFRRSPLKYHMRSPGSFLTGADSGHAILYRDESSSHARGELHIGEHNPMHPLGFFLHQLEIIRSKSPD